MNTEKSEKISDFFSDEEHAAFKPSDYTKYGYVFLFLGLSVVCLSWFGYIGNYILLGIAFILTGIVLIRKKLNDLFSFGNREIQDDEEMIDLFFKDVNDFVLKKAFQIAGIDNGNADAQNIFKFYFPVYEKSFGTESETIVKKQLDDETFMYSVWKVHIFIATKNFLSYYSCIFNWIDNECNSEVSNEFFYSDIASIKNEFTEKEILETNEEEEMPEKVKKFIVSNISGDKIEFEFENSLLKLPVRFENDIESFVREMRLLIRKKRFPKEENYTGDDVDFEIEDKRT
ncbi:MAG: hypothetical protein GXO80_05870 [Chlorobi bacterium]|nr:hypothetical protein [Chlorobiota bacterium]